MFNSVQLIRDNWLLIMLCNLRYVLMLPEKDDEGRQVFMMRPGNCYRPLTHLTY